MIDPELLEMLACPETKQSVSLLEPELLKTINEKINQGTLLNHNQQTVTQNIEGGLIREDKKCFYPIRENIPIMLLEEAIPLEGLLDPS